MPYGASAYGSAPYGGTLAPPPPIPPTATTLAVSGVGASTATMNGTANPNGYDTTVSFQWGTSTAYGNQTAGVDAGSGTGSVSESFVLSGLSPYTTYHYRIVATNANGTAYGADQTFVLAGTVIPAPAVQVTQPFTYQCYDLYTGAYKGRLQLSDVTFGSQILNPGTLSGTIDIADPAVQSLGPINLTSPARTVIAIVYLGSLVWGGVIWPRSYKFDNTSRQLTVSATEIWSYLQQRVQATDYSAPPYSGISGASTMPIWDASGTDASGVYDPVLIAWQIISDALQQVAYGNVLGGMGIAANSYTTASGYLGSGTNMPQADYLSVNYPYSSIQQVHNLVNMLASNGLYVGFDYAVDVAYSGAPGSAIVGTVNLSYPRRGRTYSQNNLVLNCANAIDYEVPEDGTQTGNTLYEQGMSGSLVVSQNVTPLQGGYPILEQIKSRANIQSANVLNVLTQLGISDLAQFSYPVTTPSVTMDLFGSSVPLGDFMVGDDARWLIPTTDGAGNVFDPRFPNGMDSEWRIVGYSASVKNEGQSTIQFNLALPPATQALGPAIT